MASRNDAVPSPNRRFPPPWSVEEHTGSFCIKDATGQAAPRMNIFMVLTGYFDESGTHAGSELTLMAGFVGDARQWRKFEKRAGKLFGRFRVDIFHAVDVRRSDKDFAGWSVDRKIEFFDEFQHIINETLQRGFASSGAARRPTPSTLSSTHWCRMLPTAPCCVAVGSRFMGGSRPRWKVNFPKP
jgi:hypothetical protein